MSSDDYANHILQKYRIATAIATLRSKPEGMSIENHISMLRHRINSNNLETEAKNDNFDVSSDDFEFDGVENIDEYDDDKIYDLKTVNERYSEVVVNEEDKYKSNKINTDLEKTVVEVDNALNNEPMDIIESTIKNINDIETVNGRDNNAALKNVSGFMFGLNSIEKTLDSFQRRHENRVEHKNTNEITFNTNKAIAIDKDEALIANCNDEVLSLNDSVTILGNVDVDMEEERRSLTEVLEVLREINQNKVDKEQNEVIDLTQFQERTPNTNILDAKRKPNIKGDLNKTKPNDDNSKDIIALNLAKKIRKNFEKENKKTYLNQTSANIPNNDTDVSKSVEFKKNIENSNVVLKSPETNTPTILTETNNYNINSLKLSRTNIINRDIIREDIAAKVLKNINNSNNLRQQKPNLDNDNQEKDVSERILPVEIDLDETNNNDSEIKLNNTNTFSEINNLNTKFNPVDNIPDTQDTILYTVHGFTQNYTHVSQSQSERIIISDKFIHGNKKLTTDKRSYHSEDKLDETADVLLTNNEINEELKTPEIELANKNSLEENQLHTVYVHNIINKDGKMFLILKENALGNYTDVNNDREIKTNDILYAAAEKTQDLTEDDETSLMAESLDDIFADTLQTQQELNLNLNEEIPTQIVILHNNNNKTNNNCSILSKNIEETYNLQPSNQNLSLNEDLTQKSDYLTQNLDQENTKTALTESEDEMEDRQSEVIPFKILEELNKVKGYLKKADYCLSGDGYTTDSGYRSTDSQSKSSYKSTFQISGTCLNQSAHSIYAFLLHCPLVVNTEDICNEISMVLGQLIDKLHEEERYPSFIEEMFDTINVTLQDLYQGTSDCDNLLQKKDENIRRLLLLNQSHHLLSYTLEKITEILQKIHHNLTTEEIFELTNIGEIENVSYIFFVLEKLIHRYMKFKFQKSNSSSQNARTQSQNDERVLKRSSLTEIWKKKWYPDFKDEKKIQFYEENNCLSKCSEVLNKIIVDCMDGYSLIAYAALQCYNILQN